MLYHRAARPAAVAADAVKHLARKRFGQHFLTDGAPCNHGPDVRVFLAANPRLKLVKLPPYSPNLNLVERLWLLFNKSVIYNKFHPTLADFKSAINDFFAALPAMKETLASLLIPKFHLFSTTPAA